jgi:hypothetical protein
MPTRPVRARVAPQRPLNRFSTLDSPTVQVAPLHTMKEEMLTAAGVTPAMAGAVVAQARGGAVRSALDLLSIEGLSAKEREQIARRTLFADDARIAIVDVAPVDGRIMSGRAFALRVAFAALPAAAPVLASARVQWAGEPFTVERLVGAAEARRGYVDLLFDAERSLPTGPATFFVSLFNGAGARARFRATCAVLPSNPFSLQLSPNTNFVTGTFSLRAVRRGNAFETDVNVTLSNGDAAPVPMSSQYTWRFWDGGVGGTLVEQGTGAFPGAISVPPFDTWGGWISFSSPDGSGVFDKYQHREDLTLEIVMHRARGGDVSGTITARTMFRFGLNITKVAGEDFTVQESADLYDAVQVTRTIYERHDVTFDVDRRLIPRASVGGFETIDTEGEARDLWNDWSGPDTNHNIDAFIVQLVAIPIPGGGTADGIDGDVPGPTSHAGPKQRCAGEQIRLRGRGREPAARRRVPRHADRARGRPLSRAAAYERGGEPHAAEQRRNGHEPQLRPAVPHHHPLRLGGHRLGRPP